MITTVRKTTDYSKRIQYKDKRYPGNIHVNTSGFVTGHPEYICGEHSPDI